MKKLIILMLVISVNSYCQVVIKTVKKYNTLEELKGMNKGQLKALYAERVRILYYKIHYLALTNKDSFGYADVGIKASERTVRILANQVVATDLFLTSAMDFQEEVIPFADSKNIIKAILLFEQILKDIYVIND